MRLPAFAYELPQGLDEALELLHTHGTNCKILAGGTDLLVRMKQGLASPTHLISLKAVPELAIIRESGCLLRIGAAVRLADILAYEPIQDRWPSLAEAVTSIGAPSIQHFAGTIGGNLCQDNRCQFYNQSRFFRRTKQACNKAGGKTCFAWEGGSDRCHSICPSDAAPALIAMDAHAWSFSQSRESEPCLLQSSILLSASARSPWRTMKSSLKFKCPTEDPAREPLLRNWRIGPRSTMPWCLPGLSYRRDGDRIVQARLVIGAVARAPLTISAAENILTGSPTGDPHAVNDAGERGHECSRRRLLRTMWPSPQTTEFKWFRWSQHVRSTGRCPGPA